MKKLRTLSLMMVLVLVLAGSLFAGGGSDGGGATATGGATELTFWTFQASHAEFYLDAVATWNKANPDRQIKWNPMTYGYDDNHNKLLTALQTGQSGPDIVDIEIGRFANYIQGSNPGLYPLNDAVQPYLPYVVTSRMDNYAKDGKYYGIDYHVGASVVFYNMNILEKAGITVADIDKIKTWDDFVKMGQTVKAKTGKPMTAYETTEHWSIYPMMSQRGSDVFAADGSVELDNKINTDILNFMLANIKSGIAIKCPGGFMHSEEWYAFMGDLNQGVGAILMPAWYMNRFTDYMPALKGKIIIRPLPIFAAGDKKSAGMGGTGTAVTKQSKNAALAAEFLAWSKLSKEQAIKIWTILGFDPVRSDIWADPAMKAHNKFTDFYGTGVFDVLYSIKDEFNPLHITALYPEGISLLQKSVMVHALETEDKTPAQALKDAADELRADLKK